VARPAQGHEVLLIVRPAFLHRKDVVGYGRLGYPAFLPADLAEGMIGKEGTADPPPVPAVAIGIAVASGVSLTFLVRKPLMLIAVSSIGEPGASWEGAWLLRSVWHRVLLDSGIQSCFRDFPGGKLP
jgi:hypothetical protein